jgi:hypothetical protein
MAEHFCQFITKWPETQDDTTEHCEAPAAIKHGYEGLWGWKTTWLCADHHDLIQKSLAAAGFPHE